MQKSKNIFLASIILFSFVTNFAKAQTQNYPSEIKNNFTNPKILGSHNLKILFFKIYNIKVFTEKKLNAKNYRSKFAINIEYNRNFSKKELVEASIDEMKRIDSLNQNQVDLYEKYLREIFVSVKKNDKKTVIIDEEGLRLFFNHELSGQIKNRDFALSFADIWLSEKAKYQDMRNDLVAQK